MISEISTQALIFSPRPFFERRKQIPIQKRIMLKKVTAGLQIQIPPSANKQEKPLAFGVHSPTITALFVPIVRARRVGSSEH